MALQCPICPLPHLSWRPHSKGLLKGYSQLSGWKLFRTFQNKRPDSGIGFLCGPGCSNHRRQEVIPKLPAGHTPSRLIPLLIWLEMENTYWQHRTGDTFAVQMRTFPLTGLWVLASTGSTLTQKGGQAMKGSQPKESWTFLWILAFSKRVTDTLCLFEGLETLLSLEARPSPGGNALHDSLSTSTVYLLLQLLSWHVHVHSDIGHEVCFNFKTV